MGLRGACILVVTCVLSLSASAQAASGCANANTPAAGASAGAMRTAVVCLINRQRASRGLPVLHQSSLLDLSAQTWTNAMVLTGVFSHGTNFASRITKVGFAWSAAGENIATGYPTPRDVVSAWMASKDHCENILSPLYLDVGTGVSPHPVGVWASGPSTWTQDFALPLRTSAPSGNKRPASRCPYK